MTPLSLLLVLLATALAHPEATPRARTLRHSRRIADSDDATYSFGYAVDVPETENFYEHEEARQGRVTRGRFRVALPDNRLQTVTYQAGTDGYTAEVSYDRHPSFPALRASVGPIGDAPEIGASVVEGLRRPGENWKDHRVQPRPDHGPRRPAPGPGTATNAIPPPRRPTTQRPSRRPSPTPPRPRPTASRVPSPTPTAAPLKRPSAPSTPTRRPRPTPVRPPTPTPPPSPPSAAALFVAAEDFEDKEILSRLIEAIKQKTEEEMAKKEEEEEKHDDSGEKRDKPRYKIGDKASVRARFDAIVHAAKF